MEITKERPDSQSVQKRPFIRGRQAIDSMRDNGFLSAAHALAELIDNSVQAQADRVELIAFETRKEGGAGKRATKQIDKIGILDNGCGMDKDTLYLALEFGASKNREDLRGIGKFGMGLPNSSISQCKRVDVWSWVKGGQIMYTYLDIDEMSEGKLEYIPFPECKKIPGELVKCLGDRLPESGTFVLWSKIDRCQWKTGNSIYKHTQDIVGRMYRYFLHDNKVSIRFRSAELNNEKTFYVIGEEHKFKANDPLYLMKDTLLPELPGDYIGEAMFETLDDRRFEIADEKGKKHKVRIKATALKKSIEQAIAKTTDDTIGSTVWGKAAKHNIGVSVVRAERELSLMRGFYPQKWIDSGKARFLGIEISFPPALDKVFGVTNNKQHVVNFKPMKLKDEWDKEGFESEQDYRSDLLANNDPKLKIYEIIDQINASIRDKLKPRMDTIKVEGTKSKSVIKGIKENISGILKKVKIKNEKREEVHPTDNKKPNVEDIKETLAKGGVSEKEAELTAKQIMENNFKVWVDSRPLATDAFFDITTENSFTLMQINKNHPFTTKILDKVPKEQKEALELCLAGWARMEWECNSDKRRQQLARARRDWGLLLEDYLDESEEA